MVKEKRPAPKHLKSSRNPAPKRPARPGGSARGEQRAAARQESLRELRREAAHQEAQHSAAVHQGAVHSDPLAPSPHISRSALLFRERLLPFVEHTHGMNQKGLRAGVWALFVLPLILLVIRQMTGSSKIAFLILWIIGMFIIAAVLIFVAYSDSELKRYLNGLKDYVPAAQALELGELLELPELQGLSIDPEALPVPAAELRQWIIQRRERRAAGHQDNDEEAARSRLIDEWITRLNERREREAPDAQHSKDHKR